MYPLLVIPYILGFIYLILCLILHSQHIKVTVLTLKVLVTTIDAQWEGMGM